MDLARQHACRRAGHDDVDRLGVEDAPDEAIPAFDELDLVQEPRGAALPSAMATDLGMAAEVLLEEGVELRRVDSGQPVVVEAQVDRALRRANLAPLGQQLLEEARLSRSPHADDRMRLTRHVGQDGVARREGAGSQREQRIAELLLESVKQRHAARIGPKLTVSQGQIVENLAL